MISFCHEFTAMFIRGEDDRILGNSKFVVVTLCLVAGQSACLVFLSIMQALLHHSTVIASALISTVLLIFYQGSDSRCMINFQGGVTD